MPQLSGVSLWRRYKWKKTGATSIFNRRLECKQLNEVSVAEFLIVISRILIILWSNGSRGFWGGIKVTDRKWAKTQQSQGFGSSVVLMDVLSCGSYECVDFFGSEPRAAAPSAHTAVVSIVVLSVSATCRMATFVTRSCRCHLQQLKDARFGAQGLVLTSAPSSHRLYFI